MHCDAYIKGGGEFQNNQGTAVYKPPTNKFGGLEAAAP
jgi:hypothetical protein